MNKVSNNKSSVYSFSRFTFFSIWDEICKCHKNIIKYPRYIEMDQWFIKHTPDTPFRHVFAINVWQTCCMRHLCMIWFRKILIFVDSNVEKDWRVESSAGSSCDIFKTYCYNVKQVPSSSPPGHQRPDLMQRSRWYFASSSFIAEK